VGRITLEGGVLAAEAGMTVAIVKIVVRAKMRAT
jgi:hypothetical protein